MMKKTALLAAIIYGFAAGCYYDVEEELYGTTACDTLDVTYGAVVLPLLQDKCMDCHSTVANSGNITLEGYDNLKTYVDNGRFLGAIKWESGYSAMPKNQSKMLDCDIEKIETWVNAGAPNN